ncbi:MULTISPECIES: GNAT family N-acetyltransferase [Catenuloplanes]|uniref:Ribosomal protein S18 acetylase RimI-like enzyme n=1 Tax=Catenuloplanes niger TaxID=587534 RepID=A0AAE3ZHX9_9ACTN|nr:GNAT family N-acetyltransferase [Catenuloplanes niger]MDR7320223.1 ribosomal protein S18 acetylase RimI-like enzyme [Catenuloplanes niger]
MGIELRPAVPADVEAIARLWHRGWHDGHVGSVPEALVAVRTPESFPPRVTDRLAHITVAVDGDEPAGFIMVAGDEVEQVYVAAAHRGTGVAGMLLAEAERQVAAAGHDTARLAVAPGNARARRFYERQGWRDGGGFDFRAEVGDTILLVPVRRYLKHAPAHRPDRHAGRMSG